MNGSDILYGSYVVIAAVGALIHLFISRHTLNAHRIAEILLLWILVVLVGVSGLIAAIFHLAFPEQAAALIGWEDSPFQREVGFADLEVNHALPLGFERAGLHKHFKGGFNQDAVHPRG